MHGSLVLRVEMHRIALHSRFQVFSFVSYKCYEFGNERGRESVGAHE